MGDGIPYFARAEQGSCHKANSIGWLELPLAEEQNQ